MNGIAGCINTLAPYLIGIGSILGLVILAGVSRVQTPKQERPTWYRREHPVRAHLLVGHKHHR